MSLLALGAESGQLEPHHLDIASRTSYLIRQGFTGAIKGYFVNLSIRRLATQMLGEYGHNLIDIISNQICCCLTLATTQNQGHWRVIHKILQPAHVREHHHRLIMLRIADRNGIAFSAFATSKGN